MRYMLIVGLVTLTGCADALDRLPTEASSGLAGAEVTWAAVSAGGSHTCGLTTAGAAYCWGARDVGQLGIGGEARMSCTSTPSGRPVCTEPVGITGGHVFQTVSAGFDHTCGLTARGEALCWGRGDEGQLGSFATAERCSLDGPSRVCSRRPIPVGGDHVFASIFAGYEYTCALDAGGTAWCWGGNAAGQLGAATTERCRARGSSYLIDCSSSPVAVAAGSPFESLALGSYHACGLTAEGRAYCWGHNLAGQLGTGERGTGGPEPVRVAGDIAFVVLTAGYDHTCGLSADGRTYCWGGDGPNRADVRTTPTLVADAPAFTALSRARDHSCGLDGEGAAFCWGVNDSGQLGNGEAGECGALSCTVPIEPDPVAVLGGLRFAAIGAGYQTTCAITTSGRAYCWGLNYSGELGTGTRESTALPAAVADPSGS